MTTDLQEPSSQPFPDPSGNGENAAPAAAPVSLSPPDTQLHTDTFCKGCGYNLNGQKVFRDPRLGLPICQCPSCNRYHPAGFGQTALTPWRHRLITFGLIAWLLFCTWLMVMTGIFSVALHMGYIGTFSTSRYETPDGRELQITFINGSQSFAFVGSQTAYNAAVVFRNYVRTPEELRSNLGSPQDYESWYPYTPYVIGHTALYGAMGIFLSIACWHWGRRARWTLLFPWVMGAIAFAFWRYNELGAHWILGWTIRNIILWCLYDSIVLAMGLLIGRKIARLLVRIILAPARRKFFRYLWTIDGKELPEAPATLNQPIPS